MARFHSFNRDDISLRIPIKRGERKQLSTDFHSDEFFSDNDPAQEGFVHAALIGLLQHIRHTIGKPIIINSGYRSPEHNKTVSKATHSTHIYGMGADIRTNDPKDLELIEQIAKPLAGGVKRYARHVHVDTWHQRTW